MEFLYTLFGTPLGYIMWACYKAIPIYVLALFAFTLISKVALFPFAIKTHKASIQQLVWKPRMDEIRKKYANNREKQAEEMQKLYTEEDPAPAAVGRRRRRAADRGPCAAGSA